MPLTTATKILRIFRYWQIRFHRLVSRAGLPNYTLFTIFSIITGMAAGLVAVFFHDAIDLFHKLFFDHGVHLLSFLGVGAVVAIPAVGMLLQSLMTAIAPVIAKRRGVLQVIKAVALRGGFISFRTTLFHFLAPAICIGSGGTVGPEGPAALLGGGVGSKLGRIFGLSDSRRRVFTAAGAGAAIAAVFNTPLGGVFFALEIILLNDFQSATFSALILASVAASAVSRIFLGNQPAFTFENISIGPYNQFYLYALLGVGAGLLSLLYVRYSETLHHVFQTHLLQKFPRWLVMAGVGLLLGLTGLFYPAIFGIGYDTINQILAGNVIWGTIAVLLVLKIIFVPLILASGGFGGIFAPSLFIGACYGFLFSFGLNHLFGLQLHTTTYTLVAMGALLGGINSIPISAILIIFEMSREYAFILPLMLGVITSTTIVQLVLRESIYSKHLHQQGYRLAQGREASVLRSLRVRDVMKKDFVLIPESTPLPAMIQQCIESPHNTFYTVDGEGRLTGAITMAELRPMITEYETLRQMVIAHDIANSDLITVTADDDLEHVLNLFGCENVDELPVVADDGSRKIIGTIWRQDVINAYNRASIKYDISDGLARSMRTLEKTHAVNIVEGYAIVEKVAPRQFVGKTLGRLRLRNKYGLEVLMIRPRLDPFADDGAEMVFPTADYILQEGDTLVLFGRQEKIREVEGWGVE